MAWVRALSELVTDVQDRADVAGFTGRHPAATIRRRIIESYHRLREWMTDAGSSAWVGGPYLLDQSHAIDIEYGALVPLQSTAGQTTVAIDHVRRLEAFYLTRWHEVARVTSTDADKWSNYAYVKYPIEFVLVGRGQNVAGSTLLLPDPLTTQAGTPAADVADTSGVQRVLCMPYRGGGTIPLRVWGMPELVIADADATCITLDASGFDWLILHAAVKIATRDNDSQSAYAMLSNELREAERVIRATIFRECSVPVRRRDVFDIADRYRYRRGL
jgi:hypothetical protein